MQLEVFGHEITLFYLFSQLFALAATLFSLYAFQRRRKVQILNYTVIAAACSVMHYVFLGAWAGAGSKGISMVRNALAARDARMHKVSKIAPLIFVVLYIVVGFFSYESPASLLPIVGSCVYTVGIYFGDATRLRYVVMLASAIWLVYNILVFSIVGIAAESIFILNDLIAIYRYRQRKKHPKSKRKNPRHR